jgi:hypothetical protein
VLNPRFFAWWHVGKSPVQIFEHTSINNMSDHARRLMTMTRAPEPALYAFGTGEVWLREAVESPGSIWEARQVSEGDTTKFELLCFSVANPQTNGPRLVIEIDPFQGFCVTRSTSYSNDGSIGVVQRVHNRQVAPNIWLPELVEQTMYLSWMGSVAKAAAERLAENGTPLPDDGKPIAGRLRVEIGAITFAETMPDAQFELAMLGAKEGHRAVRIGLHGEPAQDVITGEGGTPQ